MKLDRSSKLILSAIALGLLLNAAVPLVRPSGAKAAGPVHCSGTAKLDSPARGYEIDVNCLGF